MAATGFFGCPVGILLILAGGTVGFFPALLLSASPLRTGVSFLGLCLFRFAAAGFPAPLPPLPVPPLWRRFAPPTFFPFPPVPGFDLPDPSLLVEDDGVVALLAFALPDAPAMSIPST